MACGQREARRVAVEAEHAPPCQERDRPARTVGAGRARAGSADEVDPLDERPPRVLGLEQDHARYEEVEVGRAERAGQANVAQRVAADADEVDVGRAVDLRAAEEEGVDPSLRGAVEQLPSAFGEEVVLRAAEQGHAHPPARARAGEQRAGGGNGRERTHRHMARALEQVGGCRDQELFGRVLHVPPADDVLVEVVPEALFGLGRLRVQPQVRAVGRVAAAQPDRPGSLARLRDGRHVQRRDRPGGRAIVGQQVVVTDRLDGHERHARRVRHRHELPAHADPDVAVAIGHGCVEEGDVGLDRGQQQDGIACFERVVDHPPVAAVGLDVRAQDPAQRNERHALLGRLQAGVDGRAGRVADRDEAARDGLAEARSQAVFAERHRRCLDDADAAGADQQVGLQAGLRHGDQLQIADASPDQRAHGCHGAARVVRGHRQAGSVGDPRGELLDGLEASAHVEEGI